MKYLYCVGVPLGLQILAVYIIGVMNTGNGSWLGLMAFLLAIPVIPLTAIINAGLTRKNYLLQPEKTFVQSIAVAIATPLVIVCLFSLSVVMEGLIDRVF